ncbi:hypothetical protein [Streptomyces niger]|uniref:hypothetical protein n=1 Tax=Streptomyces niger TaxID=66373 RepID=UPI0018FEBA76|nr:hypothetical protein [Streptomyces niger]
MAVVAGAGDGLGLDGVVPLRAGPDRQRLHGRLVAAGLLPNTPPVYRRFSARTASARREGGFPDLIDTLREVHVPPPWPDAGAFVREMPQYFRLDRTRGQPYALYVAAEKDTLRQLLTGWLAEYGLPVSVVPGFGSQSYADLVRRCLAHEDREAVLWQRTI